MRFASARRRRVLFVTNDGPIFVSHRLPVAIAALEDGFEVHLALPFDTGALAVIEAAGCILHDLPLDRRGTGVRGEWRLLLAMFRLYRRLRPSLAHHYTVKPVLYGSLVRRVTGGGPTVNAITGLGYLFIAQGLVARLRRWLVERIYAVALGGGDTISIFQNPDDLALFINRGLVDPDRVALIRGSGVNLSQYTKSDERDGIPVVILPARMLIDKGVLEFVQAARILREKGIQARFALVGGRDVNPSAISQAQLDEWHEAGVVEWWGHRTDMVEVLRQATLVCLPSYREGVPKALLEALATGRAIVTTDVPGCREVVNDGENGLLVPARDSAALAEAIGSLLCDPGRRHRMANAGRRRAELEFSTTDVVSNTLQVYERLMAEESQRSSTRP